ncbi:MAG: hypothetical protein AVDCRST_MAG57-2480, partial [uncultured Blastococcus sp.]
DARERDGRRRSPGQPGRRRPEPARLRAGGRAGAGHAGHGHRLSAGRGPRRPPRCGGRRVGRRAADPPAASAGRRGPV